MHIININYTLTNVTQEDVIFNLKEETAHKFEMLQQILQRSYLETSQYFIVERREWLFFNSCLVEIVGKDVPELNTNSTVLTSDPVRTVTLMS